MTEIFFGDSSSHATIFFERQTKICIIVANTGEHLSSALATARALKADTVLVVAPLYAISGTAGLPLYPRRDLATYEYKP